MDRPFPSTLCDALKMKTTQSRHAEWVWLLLMLATCITFWLGESGTTLSHGTLAVQIMFALVFVKGWLVADHFMGLRHAPAHWRWSVIGWLLFVCLLILLAYWLGTLKR